MTRHEMVEAVAKRIAECRDHGFTSDHAIASNVVGVFEDHVKAELGNRGLKLIFEDEE